MSAKIRLQDLRPGALFVTGSGVYAVKSEYYNTSGQCECILLASGEYAHFPDGNETMVREVLLGGLRQASSEQAIEHYYRSRARGTKMTLKDLATKTGMSYGYLRQVKAAYDKSGKWGSKKDAS